MIQIKTFWDDEERVNEFLEEIGRDMFISILSAVGNYSNGSAAHIITVIYNA